jgi:hypothetical protein
MTSEKLSERFDYNSFKSKVNAKLKDYIQFKIDANEYDEWEIEDRLGKMQEIFEELTDLCANAVLKSDSNIGVFDVITGLMHEKDENDELIFNKTLQVRFLQEIFKSQEADENVLDIRHATRKATKETMEEIDAEKVANA